jgi:DNA-binding NarL/FixJ family response regulator
MKVILADDHVLFRDGFSLLFRQLEGDAQVREASSLEQAMEIASHEDDVDLALLDLDMPGMNGTVGVSHMTSAYPQLPVIVLSANESRGIVKTVIAAGASGFIPKSSSSVVMQSAIRLVLSGGIYLPSKLFLEDVSNRADDLVKNGPSRLTERQNAVLQLLVTGMSNKQICRELGLGAGTVKAHITAIFQALNVSNRTEAADVARRLGMID